MPHLADVLLAAYLAAQAGLAAFGVHRLVLLRRFRRPAPRPDSGAPGSGPTALRDPGPPPMVTVQLPIYNERLVVGRLIRAACALEWPRERLEIQVLDDSTDETREIAGRLVAHYGSRGFRIVHLRRPRRAGFKAGALAAGLRRARGELLAVFDADFVPPADFLRRALPAFADPRVGMVQARWGHANRDESALTRCQAVLLDGHFRIEQAARHASGLFFNFNGTAGVWRRACVEQAGGWQLDTLTEDLDLSYRAQLAGWRFIYRDDLVAPAELPAGMAAFKSQQHRWAKGSIQTLRKLLPAILRAPLPRRQKVEAIFHLGNNAAYLLLLLLAVLLIPSLPARARWGWPVALLETPLFLLGSGSFCLFFRASQRAAGERGWRGLARLPAVMALGIGLAVNNGRAVVEGLRGGTGEFRRTPKRGSPGAGARAGGAYGSPLDPLLAAEAAMALYLLIGMAWAAREGSWGALPFLALFAAGFGSVAAAQVAEAIRRAAGRLRIRAPDGATAGARHLRS
jgi:cellulose synthase/poly-beta-1,6-N-acetylglucosamine synthase-like glycosyltransferase